MQWRPIQMRISMAYFAPILTLLPRVFLRRERGKQEPLIWMKNSHFNRTPLSFCCDNFCNDNFNELHNGRYKFVESHLLLLKIVLDSNKSSTISMCCHIRMHDTSTKRKQRWVFCPITKTYHTTARYMHHKTSVIFTLKRRFFRPNHDFPCLMGNISLQ